MRIEQGWGAEFSCFLSSPHNLLHIPYSHAAQEKNRLLHSRLFQDENGYHLFSLVKFLQITILGILQLSSIQSLSQR